MSNSSAAPAPNATAAAPAVQASIPQTASGGLKPIPLPQPKRKIELTVLDQSAFQQPNTVEGLEVRKLKGAGAFFTPNLPASLRFNGIVYKPTDEFEDVYQIVAGALLQDPRIRNRIKQITFVPAFDWSTYAVVLLPYALNKFGAKTLSDLQTLHPRFPNYKAFVEWDDKKKRHLVRYDDLPQHERQVIADVTWPTQDEILEALQASAYDDINVLAEANATVKALLSAKEVG